MKIEDEGTEVGWAAVFDGLNEVSRKIYFMLHGQLETRGLHDGLAAGEESVGALREKLGIPAAVEHRFRVALQALRAIGVVGMEADRVRLLGRGPAASPVDDELIEKVFGPTIGAYLAIYQQDRLFDPAFSLSFAGEQSALWEGLLNAPINTVGGDQAVEWIGKPGARVLEMAFGPGRTIGQLLGRIGEHGEVFGIDSSRYYVERAREAFAGNPSVRLREADINEGMGYFEDESFDGAMFMGALQFVEDPRTLCLELSRILRHRGRICIGAFHTDKPCFSKPALHLHRNLFEPPAFEYGVERVKGWLREGGLETNIAVEFGSYCSIYAQKVPEIMEADVRPE